MGKHDGRMAYIRPLVGGCGATLRGCQLDGSTGSGGIYSGGNGRLLWVNMMGV